MNEKPAWLERRMESVYVDENTMARILGLPTAWVKNNAREGKIPYLKAGRSRMYDHKLVVQFVEQMQTGPQKDSTP